MDFTAPSEYDHVASHLHKDETWDDGVAAEGVVGCHLVSRRKTCALKIHGSSLCKDIEISSVSVLWGFSVKREMVPTNLTTSSCYHCKQRFSVLLTAEIQKKHMEEEKKKHSKVTNSASTEKKREKP